MTRRRIIGSFNNNHAKPLVLVLREHDSVWTPQARPCVVEEAQAIHEALSQLGYSVVSIQVPSAQELPALLEPFDPRHCIVLNWFEGVEDGANDGIQVVEELDRLGFAYTGSDARALIMTQDKARIKCLLDEQGIPTPRWQMLDENLYDWTTYPAIVKVTNEHGSEHLTAESVVYDDAGLRARADALYSIGLESLMVAEFAEGREFTVALWGNHELSFLPLVEVDYTGYPEEYPRLRSYAAKWDDDSRDSHGVHLKVASGISRRLRNQIERISLKTYTLLGLRDFGRIDIRMNHGVPCVIDVNANPDITLEGSFYAASELAGISYATMLERIVRLAALRIPQ